MAENNRKCNVCGKAYQYCGHCSDNAKKGETWRNLYCSDNCRKIFDILSSRAFDHITDKEAKEKLKGLDLSKVDSFNETYKKQIRQIQSAPNGEVKPQQPQTNQPQNKEIVKQDFKKQN